LRDLVSGIVLIGIGFLFGGSVFLGDFTVWSIFFDGLGVFLIVRGVVKLLRRRQG
jgi:hypothetical protein